MQWTLPWQGNQRLEENEPSSLDPLSLLWLPQGEPWRASRTRTADMRPSLVPEADMLREAIREVWDARRAGGGCLAYIGLNELPQVLERLGAHSLQKILQQVAALALEMAGAFHVAGHNHDGQIIVLLRNADTAVARQRLDSLAQRIAATTFQAEAEHIHLTPIIGFAMLDSAPSVKQLSANALNALDVAARQLDLQSVVCTPAIEAGAQHAIPGQRGGVIARALASVRPLTQIVGATLLPLIPPFALYVGIYRFVDPSSFLYMLFVFMLGLTSYLIWREGLLAIRLEEPPAVEGPLPPATAIIAAYLPNEAATIVEAIETFLRIEYAGPFQVILAYNTPRQLPVEALLRDIAERDPRFQVLHVAGSTSKAQNVNAALAAARGEFIGIFDADHHPATDSFTRAWRWLAHGYDVVQGHCVIRNGDESWVARMVAVEFETIYAVSHVGRARMHGFGIFGGSNGYWRGDTLRRIRMRASMLTEDIDSSLRALLAGAKIAVDPQLYSYELAPVTWRALWNQRMRWAQGWFQVSTRHFWAVLRSPHFSHHQKWAAFHLLVWRELYPWLSLQILPLLAYWIWRYGLNGVELWVPIFVLTTMFTLSSGPGQTLFAYLLAAPRVRRRRWFLFYLVIAMLFYNETKNLIGRMAVLKELQHERQWKVTPRSSFVQQKVSET